MQQIRKLEGCLANLGAPHRAVLTCAGSFYAVKPATGGNLHIHPLKLYQLEAKRCMLETSGK